MSVALLSAQQSPSAPDLRLLPAAACAWAAVLVTLFVPVAGGLLGAVLAVAGLLSGAVALGLGRPSGHPRRRRIAAATAAACAVGCAAALSAGVRESQARHGPLALAASHRETAVLDVVVTGDPKRSESATGGRVHWFGVVPVRVLRFSVASVLWSVDTSALLITPADAAWLSLLPSEHARVAGRLEAPRGHDLLGAAVAVRGPPDLTGGPSTVQRFATRLRTGLLLASQPSGQPVSGLLPGLVDGDVSRLDPAVASAFLAAGMTHLVAVSGANVAIVVGTVQALLRRLRVTIRVAVLGAAVTLAGFVVLVRPSPSVLRAALMSALFLVAILTGRRRAGLPALLATVVGLLLVDPGLAVQPGFALSVLATAGLLTLTRPIAARLRRRLPGWLAGPAAVAVAAQVACLPVLVLLWGQVSLVAVPANMLAEPAVPAATVIGLVATVVAQVCLPAARLVALAAAVPTWWIAKVATWASSLPGGNLTVAPGLLSAAVTLAVGTAAWWGVARARRRDRGP